MKNKTLTWLASCLLMVGLMGCSKEGEYSDSLTSSGNRGGSDSIQYVTQYEGTWYLGNLAEGPTILTKINPIEFSYWPAKELASVVITDMGTMKMGNQLCARTSYRPMSVGYAAEGSNNYFEFHADNLANGIEQTPSYKVEFDGVPYTMYLDIDPYESSMILTSNPFELTMLVRFSSIRLTNDSETKQYPTQLTMKFISHTQIVVAYSERD